MDPRIVVSWRARADALTPIGALAADSVAMVLVRRLLAMDDERLERLEGVASKRVVVVLGETEVLPWVDGIAYLGRQDDAPSLLLPTNEAPSVPAALLERAVARRCAGSGRQWAISSTPAAIVPISAARRLHRVTLEAWAARAGTE